MIIFDTNYKERQFKKQKEKLYHHKKYLIKLKIEKEKVSIIYLHLSKMYKEQIIVLFQFLTKILDLVHNVL